MDSGREDLSKHGSIGVLETHQKTTTQIELADEKHTKDQWANILLRIG